MLIKNKTMSCWPPLIKGTEPTPLRRNGKDRGTSGSENRMRLMIPSCVSIKKNIGPTPYCSEMSSIGGCRKICNNRNFRAYISILPILSVSKRWLTISSCWRSHCLITKRHDSEARNPKYETISNSKTPMSQTNFFDGSVGHFIVRYSVVVMALQGINQ